MNLKKNINKFLVLLIGIFIIYSINVHLEFNHLKKQSLDRNYHYLSIISVTGTNLANRLEEFVQLPVEDENSEVENDLYNNWRIVSGESKAIVSYLFAISTLHVRDDEASDWDLLRYSLSRVDGFISSMTYKFLENHSYAISSEEKGKMEAVISVFRSIATDTKNEPVNLKVILESIKAPMLVIDHNYPGVLERMGR